MGRYVKNLKAFKGNANFMSGSHEFKGSLEISHDGEAIALFRSGSTNIESLAYFKDSNVGIGTAAPTSKLTVNGNVNVTGSILPGASLTYSLGSATHRWEELYLGTGSVHLGPTCKISTNEASGTIIANKPFVVEGGLILSSSSYINFSPTTGSTGYGFRDNAGAMEYKSTGSEWLPVGSSGKLIRNRNAIVTHYTVTSNDSIIGVNATASLTISLPDPTTLTVGQCFLIKDEAGNASTHNITINTRAGTADRIDGGTTLSMTVNNAGFSIYTDGSNKYFIY